MELISEGKVKRVYSVDDETLEFEFTDKVSVFDKVIPSLIEHKGETLCRTSAFWFEKVRGIGIKSHYIQLISRNRMRVRRVKIIRDYSKIDQSTTNYLIPLEFICRHYISGSLYDRIRRGELKPEDLGFSHGHELKYGEELPEPFFETTTKLESVDRKVNKEEARKIAGLSKSEYDEIKETVLHIDEKVKSEVERRGLIHVDGKKEFAFDAERELMLVDTFGTADEDRFWDLREYENGNCIELSKESVRQYYRGIGYLERLENARMEGIEEPEIPPLPDEIARRVSRLYIQLFERITGESFR